MCLVATNYLPFHVTARQWSGEIAVFSMLNYNACSSWYPLYYPVPICQGGRSCFDRVYNVDQKKCFATLDNSLLLKLPCVITYFNTMLFVEYCPLLLGSSIMPSFPQGMHVSPKLVCATFRTILHCTSYFIADMAQKNVIRCVAANCGEESHLMRFPTDNNLRQQWINWVKETDATFKYNARYNRLCYRHFDVTDIHNYDAYRHGFAKQWVYRLHILSNQGVMVSLLDQTYVYIFKETYGKIWIVAQSFDPPMRFLYTIINTQN